MCHNLRMDVYDYTTLDMLEGDAVDPSTGQPWQLVITNEEGGQDPVEVTKIIEENGAVWVKGYSHLTGDSVNYCLTPDTEVGLWTA